jgi:hypothetical protein
MTRSPFAQKLRLSLDYETHKLLKQYALFARRPMAALAAGIVSDFLAQRAALGDGLPTTDRTGQRTPILQEVIEGTEHRIAATLNGQSESLCELRAMVEKLAEAVLLHAPETPPGERAAAKERGERRYKAWQTLVTESVGRRP